MSCNVIAANAYELEASRKRKRRLDRFEDIQQDDRADAAAATTTTTATTPTSDGFTNEAFSSTPKKLIARRRILPRVQAISNNFIASHNLEEKSIAALVSEKANTENVPTNPFEVVRKPPKKKKCEKIAEACFENPALNLEMPEKQFNPYEVQRESLQPLPQCFVNEALNIKGQDVSASRNPFEIPRVSEASELAANPNGVDNKALEDVGPSRLKIGLPFTPTVGCRIDFKNISLSELTPSKLLADKLVFSPAPKPKRSLSSINEETMDIGRELDLYQLELENSINEAKLRREAGLPPIGVDEATENVVTVVTEVAQTVEVTQKITQTCTASDGSIVRRDEKIVERKELSKVEEEVSAEIEMTEAEEPLIQRKGEMAQDSEPNVEPPIEDCANDDVEYASEESDIEDEPEELDFKAPAPFVRAYRRPVAAQKAESKESLDSQQSESSGDGGDSKKPLGKNMKSFIRSSIRKLMHPGGVGEAAAAPTKPEDKPEEVEKHHNFMHTIRHSLRRKPSGKQPLIEEDETLPMQDISIIDTSERTKKFSTLQPQTDYVKIEELTNERKHSLRNSIRRSTRDLMNTVFHKKHEEYAFCK